MTWWARRFLPASAWRAALIMALALAAFACARQPPPYAVEARTQRAATLVPADLALAFLKEIKSQSKPPCLFTEQGLWSGGEYRKITGQRSPNFVIGYGQWVLFKIEDPSGRDFAPAELDKGNAWNYSLRAPRSARTVFGTSDHCILGPTPEPARKVVEALSALGVALSPEYSYIVR